MGVDLTLLLGEWDNLPGTIYPTIQIPLERRHKLWERMRMELETLPLGQEIYWHDDDEGLEKRHDDQYGEPLRFTQAAEFAKLLRSFNETEESVPWMNAAAAAYLSEMMPVKRVILWWH